MSNFLYRTDKDITQVYEKYADMVYRICFMMLKNESETEDATQNVFIKLLNYGKELKSDEHLKAWLIVTAKNECKNMLKHWWRQKTVDMDSVSETAYFDKPEDGIIEKVKNLPDKYKIPIYLHYYEGYSTEEISVMLNINHSTVRGQLATGRKKLKLMIKDGEEYEY